MLQAPRVGDKLRRVVACVVVSLSLHRRAHSAFDVLGCSNIRPALPPLWRPGNGSVEGGVGG